MMPSNKTLLLAAVSGATIAYVQNLIPYPRSAVLRAAVAGAASSIAVSYLARKV